MNFSEEYDCDTGKGRGCQSIFFATSKDLISWSRLPFAPPPANDSNVFKYGPGYTVGGRWDSLHRHCTQTQTLALTPNPKPKPNGRWDCIATVPKPGSPG